MTKRILTFILALLLPISSFAFTDVTEGELLGAVELLRAAEILDGYADGSYRPEEYVTREQFAKIAVCILGQREKAAASLAATAFTDVSPDNWARGYISYVAREGIIAGFPDGSFGGGNVITYAQAVTVLMRCLGYSDSDIGFHWPSDYVNKAAALGLNRGVYLLANDNVSRGNMALLIYNALMTDVNGGEDILLAKTGLTVYEDALLYGKNKTDPSIVETGEGGFKYADGAISASDYGKSGLMLADKKNRIVFFKSSEGTSEREIIIASAVYNGESNTVEIGYGGGALALSGSTPVYCDGEKTTAADAAASMTAGSKITLYHDSN